MERGFEGVAGGEGYGNAGICLVRRQRDPHAYTYAYARACTYVEPTRCHGCTCALFIPSVWHTREPHVHPSLVLLDVTFAEFTVRIADRRGLYRRGCGGKGGYRDSFTSCPRLG